MLERVSVLYVTPYVPYEGIDHAGGDFLYEYLRLLSGLVKVQVLSVGTGINQRAAETVQDWLRVYLAAMPEFKDNYLRKFFRVGYRLLIDPLGLGREIFLALSSELGRIFAGSNSHGIDIVELQWSQTLRLAPIVKCLAPDIRLAAFEHDVFAQSVLRRSLGASRRRERILNKIIYRRVKNTERDLLNLCDVVFCFSNKDRKLLVDMGVNTRTEVVAPLVRIPGAAAEPQNNAPIVLFFGAMHRPENSEGICWFLHNVWPTIKSKVRGAKLWIVGANPPEPLQKLARADQSIIVTGYVKEPGTYFKRARVFIAPLLSGAGVKFKVLQAMAFGLPVVGTSVAWEGIKEEYTSIPAIETNDPHAFANYVLGYLCDATKAARDGAMARAWVCARYDFKESVKRIAAVYADLCKTSPKKRTLFGPDA